MHRLTHDNQKNENAERRAGRRLSEVDETKKQPPQSMSSVAVSNRGLLQRRVLQQTIGNQAVQHLLRSRAIQAKLTINEPGDQYEQEADWVAEQVMRVPHREVFGQKQVKHETEKEVQTKRTSSNAFIVTSSIKSGIRSLQQSGGQPLAPSILASMENHFGHDFAGVRVHNDARAARLANGLNARAFTVGSNIVFGLGELQPGTMTGRRLLAHELTHVVQQRASSANNGAVLVQRQPKPDPDPDPPFKLLNTGFTVIPIGPRVPAGEEIRILGVPIPYEGFRLTNALESRLLPPIPSTPLEVAMWLAGRLSPRPEHPSRVFPTVVVDVTKDKQTLAVLDPVDIELHPEAVQGTPLHVPLEPENTKRTTLLNSVGILNFDRRFWVGTDVLFGQDYPRELGEPTKVNLRIRSALFSEMGVRRRGDQLVIDPFASGTASLFKVVQPFDVTLHINLERLTHAAGPLGLTDEQTALLLRDLERTLRDLLLTDFV